MKKLSFEKGLGFGVAPFPGKLHVNMDVVATYYIEVVNDHTNFPRKLKKPR